MHIWMLAPRYWPHVGGVEKHVEQVAMRLVQLGHSVRIVTRRRAAAEVEEEEWNGVRIYRVGGPGVWGKFRIWSDLLRLRNQISTADVIHCHDFAVFLYWLLPVRLLVAAKKPVFITFHGYEGFPLKDRHVLLRRWAAKHCAGSIAVGHFIERWYGTRHDMVTYGGVEMPPAPLSSRATATNDAVFVGRLALDTGIMDYLKALTLLRERGVNVPLDVFGGGPLAGAVEAYAQEHGLDVRLHGFVPNVAPRVGAYRLAFVSGYLAILEALAAGVSVVSVYDNPLKRDYLSLMPGATDYLSVCGTPAEVAASVERNLAEPVWSAERLEAGLAFAATCNWERVSHAYMELYRRAIVRS